MRRSYANFRAGIALPVHMSAASLGLGISVLPFHANKEIECGYFCSIPRSWELRYEKSKNYAAARFKCRLQPLLDAITFPVRRLYKFTTPKIHMSKCNPVFCSNICVIYKEGMAVRAHSTCIWKVTVVFY